MEDSRYLETINELSNTVKELAIEKNKKIHEYKTIIIAFILAIIFVSGAFAACIAYGIHNIYGYDYSATNVNKNGGDR